MGDHGESGAFTTKGELYRKINELESENDALGQEIMAWRSWYTNSYVPQMEYIGDRVSVLSDPSRMLQENVLSYTEDDEAKAGSMPNTDVRNLISFSMTGESL